MAKRVIALSAAAAVVLVVAGAVVALARHGGTFTARLSGYTEVPAVSTTGQGSFVARLHEGRLRYELTYFGLEGTAAMAHIHLGRPATEGGVIAFLCGGGSAPDCPAEGSVSGVITADDVIGPDTQGIDAGEFRELVRALRANATYVNVHTDLWPDGEIRGEVRAQS